MNGGRRVKAKILSIAAAVLMIAVILVALPLTIPKLFGIHILDVKKRKYPPAKIHNKT